MTRGGVFWRKKEEYNFPNLSCRIFPIFSVYLVVHVFYKKVVYEKDVLDRLKSYEKLRNKLRKFKYFSKKAKNQPISSIKKVFVQIIC